MPKPDHLWDEHEAARYLGVTNYAIRKWKAQQKLGFIKLGSLVRYVPAEVKAFAERSRVFPTCENCGGTCPPPEAQLPDEADPSGELYAEVS